MSANPPDNMPRVLLSRNELLVILKLLAVADLPGLGPDPLGELSAEQQAYGMTVAERSLRAREMALVDQQGALLVQREVLELIGSCALAQGTLVVTDVRPSENRANQWFGHRLDTTFVAHFLPDSALHQFNQVADRAALAALIGDFASWPDCPAAPLAALELTGAVLAAAREQAGQDGRTAARLLVEAGADAASAEAVAAILSSAHGVTVVQAIHRRDADTAAVTSVTVLYNKTGVWVMTEMEASASPGSGAGDGLYRLGPATRPQVEALIQQLEW